MTSSARLIYDLILIETWRERVYPLLVEHLVGGGENEATTVLNAGDEGLSHVLVGITKRPLVNLLECLCYHAHAVGAVKDASLDLTRIIALDG